jgi:hypothetical protein
LIAQQPREAGCGAQLEGAGALLAGDGEGAVVAGGSLVGAPGREEDVALETVEVGVEERLARLRGDREACRDRALRLGELPGGLLRLGEEQEECRRSRLVTQLGREREAFHDFRERRRDHRR